MKLRNKYGVQKYWKVHFTTKRSTFISIRKKRLKEDKDKSHRNFLCLLLTHGGE